MCTLGCPHCYEEKLRIQRMNEAEQHQIIRAKGLEEKNIFQANRIMELEFFLKRDSNKALLDSVDFKAYVMLKKEYQRMVDLQKEQQEENKRLKEEVEELRTPEKEGNVIPFERPVTSTGGGGSSGNWLMDLQEGAVFLCRKRVDKTPEVEQWHLQVKWKRCAILYTNMPRGEGYRMVDGMRFSAENELVEVLRNKREMLDD